MRVTHVITRLIVGGAQENTISTVLGLRSRPDVEVDLITGPTSGPEGSLEEPLLNIPGLLTRVPTLVRPVDPRNDLKALLHLTRIFRERRPDIVHTHSGKAGILGRIAAHHAGVPVIIHTVHGPSFGPFQGSVANFTFRTAERYAARFTDHFVTVANAMTDQYVDAGISHREKFSRILSGFDLQPFLTAQNDAALRHRLQIAPGDFVVGKIARLFELKGHDDLFSIAPQLVSVCPTIKFLFVGDGPWREKFQAQAQKLGLQKHFIMTGLVPPQDVARYVGIMDVLIHLSRREGLPRAIPQALAAGKPAIAFDCDGAREVCLDGETGYLVAPGDLKVLTRRILELANDPALRNCLGLRGQELVKELFPVERMVDEIYQLYRHLLAHVKR